MATRAKSEPAPIYTADGQPLSVGMPVYRFDHHTDLKEEPGQYIQRLVVTELDLTARARWARLRLASGREWRYYPMDHPNGKYGNDYRLYARLPAAVAAAVPVVERLAAAATAGSVERAKEKLERAKEEHREAVAEVKGLGAAAARLRRITVAQLEADGG